MRNPLTRTIGIGLTAALVLLFRARADAYMVHTPPLHPPTAGTLMCAVVNVSGKPLDIQARIIDENGADVTDALWTHWGPDGQTLAGYDAASVDDGARFCRVTVSGGGRNDVRVSLMALDASGGTVVALEGH